MSAPETSAVHDHAVLLDITCLARSGLAEVASMAHTLLLAMESPDFYRHPDHLGAALHAIWQLAMHVGSAVEGEAERVAVFKADDAKQRRSAAYAASRMPLKGI